MSDLPSTPSPAPLPPVSARAAALAQSIKQRQARPQGHKPQAGKTAQTSRLSVEQTAVLVEWLLIANLSYKEAASLTKTYFGRTLKEGALCTFWRDWIGPSLIAEGRETNFRGTTITVRLPDQPGEPPVIEVSAAQGTTPPTIVTRHIHLPAQESKETP